MRRPCAEETGAAQFNSGDMCVRCGVTTPGHSEAVEENKWQKCKRDGLLPWWADGSTKGKGKGNLKGKGTSKGKGKDQTWTDSAATGKGKGKGKGKNESKGKGKGSWLQITTWKDRENEKLKKQAEQNRKEKEALTAENEALKKGEVPTKEDAAEEEPKPLMTFNKQGKEVPVVAICELIGKDGKTCNKQHWSIPKSGNCVQCGLVLPVPEEKKINPLLENNFYLKWRKKNVCQI